MKVAIYSRVSTESQETENQILSLTRFANDRSFNIVALYQENESAWRSGHQKELVYLIEAAKKGKFQAVLVWALDRLSREGALAILSLVHKLNRFGCQVISYQEPWTETSGELTELLYALTGWVAKMESNRRSERTKEGLARVKAQGKQLGRPPGAKDKKPRRSRAVANILKRSALVYS